MRFVLKKCKRFLLHPSVKNEQKKMNKQLTNNLSEINLKQANPFMKKLFFTNLNRALFHGDNF